MAYQQNNSQNNDAQQNTDPLFIFGLFLIMGTSAGHNAVRPAPAGILHAPTDVRKAFYTAPSPLPPLYGTRIAAMRPNARHGAVEPFGFDQNYRGSIRPANAHDASSEALDLSRAEHPSRSATRTSDSFSPPTARYTREDFIVEPLKIPNDLREFNLMCGHILDGSTPKQAIAHVNLNELRLHPNLSASLPRSATTHTRRVRRHSTIGGNYSRYIDITFDFLEDTALV